MRFSELVEVITTLYRECPAIPVSVTGPPGVDVMPLFHQVRQDLTAHTRTHWGLLYRNPNTSSEEAYLFHPDSGYAPAPFPDRPTVLAGRIPDYGILVVEQSDPRLPNLLRTRHLGSHRLADRWVIGIDGQPPDLDTLSLTLDWTMADWLSTIDGPADFLDFMARERPAWPMPRLADRPLTPQRLRWAGQVQKRGLFHDDRLWLPVLAGLLSPSLAEAFLSDRQHQEEELAQLVLFHWDEFAPVWETLLVQENYPAIEKFVESVLHVFQRSADRTPDELPTHWTAWLIGLPGPLRQNTVNRLRQLADVYPDSGLARYFQSTEGRRLFHQVAEDKPPTRHNPRWHRPPGYAK